MDTETLTCKVCEARADYGITQQQLADATGISVRTIINFGTSLTCKLFFFYILIPLRNSTRLSHAFSIFINCKSSKALCVIINRC